MAMDPDVESPSAQELVESVIEALVQHYGDPVHDEEPDNDDDEGPDTSSSADSQRQEEEDDDAVPPVLAFQLRRLLKFGISDDDDGDDSTPCGRSSTAAAAAAQARARARVLDVWAHLVQSYATIIRPTIFVAVGNGVSPKISVVEHYQRLTRLYLKHHEEALLRSSLLPSPEQEDRRGGIPAPTTPPEEEEPSLDRRVHELQAWERVSCDVTLATALEVRRHRRRRRHKGPRRRTPVRRKPSDPRGTSASEDGTDDPVLLGGGSDSDAENDAENDTDDDVVDPTATIRICAALVRHVTTMGRVAMARRRAPTPGPTAAAVAAAAAPVVLHNDDRAPNDGDRVALRGAVAVLPFEWEPRSLLGIAAARTNTEAPRLASSSADPLHSLPMTLAPKERDDFRNLSIGTFMDWSLMLQLKGSVWDSSRKGGSGGAPADLRAAVREFGRLFGGFEGSQSSTATEESGTMDEVRMLRRWSAESVSKAVRAHFFGRDMLEEPNEDVVPTHRTRLHLGSTVRYEPDPGVTQKPHLLVPSRALVALHWMSVLRAEQLTESVWNELLPILYELLSASSYALNGWGAVALYRLVSLHDRASDSFLVSEPSETCLQNLLLMLHTIAKTCREGPVLAVAGKAYGKVLGLLGVRQPASAAQQRRAASQHWLTVLYQNQTRASTQPTLILGLLTGVIQILNDQVTFAGINNADALEVGRLGLSALLPLLVHEDDVCAALESAPNSSTGLVHGAIRIAAVVALNNLMIAAYPIIPRHAGKILSHLLRACAETQPSTKDRSGDGGEQTGVDLGGTAAPQAIPHQGLHRSVALHVTSTAAVLSEDKGHEFLVSLETDQASYCARFRKVLDDVRTGAQALQPLMAPVDQRTSATPQGRIQVV